MKAFWRSRFVRSRLGWPVPRIAKVVSAQELSSLIADATKSGYSRKAKEVQVRAGTYYYLIPYLLESSPEQCWMCFVIAVANLNKVESAERAELRYSRLDVAIARFRDLSNASVGQRDQLLHWVLWDAAKNVDGPTDTAT